MIYTYNTERIQDIGYTNTLRFES